MSIAIAQDVTVKEAADCWGITFQAAYQQVKKGHLPAPVDGKWKWPEINIIFLNHHKQLAEVRTRNKDEEELRLTRERADEVALKNAEKRGELINKDEAQKAFEIHISAAKKTILALPNKVAAVAPPGVRAIIKEEAEAITHECLNNLAGNTGGDSRPRKKGVGSTAKAKSKRVGGRKSRSKSRK